MQFRQLALHNANTSSQLSVAVKYLNEAIDLDPSNPLFYGDRSTVYTSLRQFEPALDDANQKIALEPTDANGYIMKGLIYIQMNLEPLHSYKYHSCL